MDYKKKKKLYIQDMKFSPNQTSSVKTNKLPKKNIIILGNTVLFLHCHSMHKALASFGIQSNFLQMSHVPFSGRIALLCMRVESIRVAALITSCSQNTGSWEVKS